MCPASTDCAAYQCVGAVCKKSAVAAGVACSLGVCDGLGACVQCLISSDCGPCGFCIAGICTTGVTCNGSCCAAGDQCCTCQGGDYCSSAVCPQPPC
jgi:hypothetical protein